MFRGEWAALLWIETAAIAASFAIAYVMGRSSLERVAERPKLRDVVLFEYVRRSQGWSSLTLVAPYLFWRGTHLDGTYGAPQRLFAVGWTAYVVAWLGTSWCQARVLRSAGRVDVTLRSTLGAHLFFQGWFVVPPLLAAWAVVALTAVGLAGPDGPRETEALCFAAAFMVSPIILGWPMRRSASAESAPPAAVLAEFDRMAGEGPRPPVAAAPLRRFGLSHAIAFRRRRQPHIAIDETFVAQAEPRESAAILLHELGHHRLAHLRSREWIWKGCLLVVLVVPTVVGWGHVAVFVVGLTLVEWCVLLPLWRRQELAADKFAAERCGGPLLASALATVHRDGALPDDFGGSRNQMTHPDLKRRLAALSPDDTKAARPSVP